MEHSAGLGSRAKDDSHNTPDGADVGDTLFVINLSASMTPLSNAALRIAGLEQFKTFQISRVEDGRPRHRLRLGFFPQEADAESVIATLRERYPTAFITTATAEDRRHMKGAARPAAKPAAAPPGIPASSTAQVAKPLTSKVPANIVTQPAPPAIKKNAARQEQAASPAPAKAAAAKSIAKPSAAAETRQGATAAASKPKGPATELTYGDAPISNGSAGASSAAVADGPRHAALAPAAARFQAQAPSVIDFSIEAEARKAAPAKTSSSPAKAKPFHVGAHAEVPFLDLALEADPFSKDKSGSSGRSSDKEAAAAAAIHKLSGDEIWRIPDLDSTQTIRTLTTTEVADANQPKWFVVQLALSNQAVNFDAMPQLDIFSAYRLYSVAVMEEGKILHALRLGFFKEDVSAEAVCGYIRTFFPAPAIIRVSAAEQARFADAPTPNTREAGKVVEIGGARERAGAKANANSNAAPAVGSKSAAPAAKPATQPPPGKVGAPTLKTKATQQPQFHTGSPRFSKSVQRESSLQEKLKQAAEEIAATDTGIRRIKNNPSLLSRLVGRLKN